jgi:demethylmenaquinone methyltransferase/2-methoxy-6-polyprenyl-1,4-benzoquinol methylase
MIKQNRMAIFAPQLAEVKPYQTAEKNKKQEVELMFDAISGRYDLLNKVLSLGIDRGWRKKALSMLKTDKHEHILDVATGTGDLVFMADKILHPQQITGIDLSAGMLDIARKRLAAHTPSGKARIQFIKGDAEALPLSDEEVDAVTVAFGVRNFGDLQTGLREIHRVLRPGGRLIVLEFTKPRIFPFKQIFHIYFKYILPFIGAWTSGDRRAYRYLFESVQAFPDYADFAHELTQAGFVQPAYKSLSLGICAIYTAYKS